MENSKTDILENLYAVPTSVRNRLINRAEIRSLPPVLSLFSIIWLLIEKFPDEQKAEHATNFYKRVCEECRLGFLSPHSARQPEVEFSVDMTCGDPLSGSAGELICGETLFHKDEFKRFLSHYGDSLPLECLLINWWYIDPGNNEIFIATNKFEENNGTETGNTIDGESFEDSICKIKLGATNERRINHLKNFVNDLQESEKTEGFCFNPMLMECSKDILLENIQKWAIITKNKKAIADWKTDVFDSKLWSSLERKGILDIERSSYKQNDKYFKNFKIMIRH